MRKIILLGFLLCGPAFSQFGVGDAVMIAKLEAQLAELRDILQNAQQYKQLFDNAAAFARHPAQFLAALSQIEDVALNTAATSGMTTPERIRQLQQIIRLQQVAMQEARTMSTLSNENAADIGQWANAMSTASQDLAQLNAQLQYEQREAYYKQRNTYQPQAALVSGWRLK